MELLFLGGVFDDCHNVEIISKTKTYVEYAANNFQKKLISGLRECEVNVSVLSAPFLGAYPQAYCDWYFKGFDSEVQDKSGIEYVHFINIWGLRNISRKGALKKAIKRFVEIDKDQKLIVVYSPHTPFIQAANYAKRQDSRIKICMVVPDLPQYMNLAKHKSLIYTLFKKIDIKVFQKENKTVDSFVLLTEQMKEKLNVGRRPFIVVEGICNLEQPTAFEATHNSSIKTIVYTGKLNHNFGIMELVNAFMSIEDKSLRLIICGTGEEQNDVEAAARIDSRILYKGQVAPDVAKRYIAQGDLLVNPRKNDSEYTKYSFPSKIIDYLASGNPVVAYQLDGMPKVYRNFIYCVWDDKPESLKDAIIEALNDERMRNRNKCEAALDYLETELSKKQVAKKIINLNRGIFVEKN